MIKDTSLDGFEITEWVSDTPTDDKTMTWIWNQLMGETAKGDTLEFAAICRSDEKLCAGILKGGNGYIKAIIPARYEKFRNNVMDTVDYAGRTEHYEPESPSSDFEIGYKDIDIDALAYAFLSSKKKESIV